MKEEDHSGAIVFKRGNKIKYLLIKQKGSNWGFPKRKVPLNKSSKETVKQELKREVGVENPRFLKKFKVAYNFEPEPSVIKQVELFLTEIREPIRLSNKYNQFKWAEYEELGDYIERPQILEVLRKSRSFLNG